jgi:hypothetical protein
MFKIGLQTKSFVQKAMMIFSGLAISTDNRTQAALIQF